METAELEQARKFLEQLNTIEQIDAIQELVDNRRKVLVDGQRNLD
jgi:hypothetical protein